MSRVISHSIRCLRVGALALLSVALLAVPVVAQADDDAKAKTSDKEEATAGESGDAKATSTESVYMKASTRGREAQQAKGQVYTNDDLKDLYEISGTADTAPATATPRPSAGAPPLTSFKLINDPLKALETQQAAEVARKARRARAEQELQAARKTLSSLETQLLATRNPFSKRPQLSEEEKERRATSGETAEERNARTQQLVDEAKADVAAAEKRLSAVSGR